MIEDFYLRYRMFDGELHPFICAGRRPRGKPAHFRAEVGWLGSRGGWSNFPAVNNQIRAWWRHRHLPLPLHWRWCHHALLCEATLHCVEGDVIMLSPVKARCTVISSRYLVWSRVALVFTVCSLAPHSCKSKVEFYLYCWDSTFCRWDPSGKVRILSLNVVDTASD